MWVGTEGVFIAKTAKIYPTVRIGNHSRIFDYVVIREGTTIGEKTTIGNAVCIEPNATIGSHCSINTQSHITGGIIIEDYVFFGPNVTTTNTWNIAYKREIEQVTEGPIIRRAARIGGGVTILPRVEIGENALIGAGAVVTKDVGPREIWVGNPAKCVGTVPESEIL